MHASDPCAAAASPKNTHATPQAAASANHTAVLSRGMAGVASWSAPRGLELVELVESGDPFELLTSSANIWGRVVAEGCGLSQLDSHIYISRWNIDRRRHSLPCLACSATSLGGCPHELLFAMRHSYGPRPSTWPLPYLDTSLQVQDHPGAAADSVIQYVQYCTGTQKPGWRSAIQAVVMASCRVLLAPTSTSLG
jgi:hypothetical protein